MWNDASYTKEQQIAKLVLIEMGGGYVDIWRMAGPAKASCRSSLMSELNGVKTPQAKSGVNAIKAALYTLYCVSGDTENSREQALAEAIAYHSGGVTA